MIEARLTVYFDAPFWVGVFERTDIEGFSVCKVTFGAEPQDCVLLEFVLKNYHKLHFSTAIPAKSRQTADNPKRRQRTVQKQLQARGIGTKSQQALAAQREALKAEHTQASKAKLQAEKERRFALKQDKRKKKHKGH